MPLTPHASYEDFKEEHLAAHPGTSVPSAAQWEKSDAHSAGGTGSSGRQESAQQDTPAGATDTRGESKFSVRKDMEKVGQTTAGQTGAVDVSGIELEAGDALLYDDVTGELYRTSSWQALDSNRNYIVGADGKRKRIAGYISGSADDVAEGEDQTYTYSLGDKAKPGDTWLLLDYNEDAPTPGTDEFQKRMEKTFQEVATAQALQQRYTVDENGDVAYTDGFSGVTELGTYSSVTAEDYIALGKPGSIGYVDFSGYSDMEDEELLQQGLLVGQDTADRSHGIEKTLNDIGGLWGDDNFGHEFMRVAGDLTQVPVLGTALGLVTKPIMAYEAARDAGYSPGKAGGEAGKAGLDSVKDMAIDAAAVVATIAGVLAAPFTGGASLALAGAAIGAAYGTAGAALKQGLHTTIYGGYEESDLWNAMGTGAATGAVSGAFAGIGKAGSLGGASAGLKNLSSTLGSGYVQVGKSALESYAIAYSKGGESRKDADKALAYGLVGGALQFSGFQDYSKDLGAPFKNPFLADNIAVAGDRFSFGNAWSAFREHAATESWLSPIVSRGTKSREFLQTVSSSVGKGYDAVGLLQSGNSSSVLQEIINRNEWLGSRGTLEDIGGWRQPAAYPQAQASAAPPAYSLAAPFSRAPSWSLAQDRVSPRGAPRSSPPPVGALASAYEAPWRGTYQDIIAGTSPPLGMVAPQYYR